QSVIEAQVARDSPLILAVKVEITDENLRQHGPERLAVGLPAFASITVREVLREVSNGSVCIGSDTVEQCILHVLRVRDIETELELVASPRPGEIVGKLKPILGGLDSRQVIRHTEIHLTLDCHRRTHSWRREVVVHVIEESVLVPAET